MTYCHVSAQIAQHANCDKEVTCDKCDSDNVDYEDGDIWFKHCLDCGFYEDNFGVQE